jgi:hypothetical protein
MDASQFWLDHPLLVHGSDDEAGGEATAAATAADETDADDDKRKKRDSWYIDYVNTGKHLATLSEETELMWFSIGPDLEEIIAEGQVPYFDIDSAGLNPYSHNHLVDLILGISDELLTCSLAEAVSHLRACLRVFGETLLKPIKTVSEIEVLRRIYFVKFAIYLPHPVAIVSEEELLEMQNQNVNPGTMPTPCNHLAIIFFPILCSVVFEGNDFVYTFKCHSCLSLKLSNIVMGTVCS